MKKILFLGTVVVLLSLGLVFVSCGGCIGDGKCKTDADSYVWCGAAVTDLGDAEDAMNCAVYKAWLGAVTGGEPKAECDC